MNSSQSKRLGTASTAIEWTEEDEDGLENTLPALNSKGYTAFKTHGQYLVSHCGDRIKKPLKEVMKSPSIGMMRVYFEYDPCGPATVIAQQVQDDKGKFTFRKWSPFSDYSDILNEKKDELDQQSETGFLSRTLFGCIGKKAQPSIDCVEDDIISLDNYLA